MNFSRALVIRNVLLLFIDTITGVFFILNTKFFLTFFKKTYAIKSTLIIGNYADSV